LSDSDSFIREVTDEVRQDRMAGLWKRYGPFVLGGIVAVLAVAVGLNWMEERARQQSEAIGGAFLSVQPGDAASAEGLVETVPGTANGIALLRLADAQVQAGDTDAAIASYRAVAGMPDLGRAYADLAALQAARLAAPTLPTDEAIALVDPLVVEDAPYRLLALELRAALLLNAGDTVGAHADLATILRDPAATSGLALRARELLAATGGRAPGL
jgi:hypothetical protein